MAAFLDVCRYTPTLGGTTDWTFSAAVTGYNSPALAGVVNGRVYKYRAESADLSQWEIGEGAYNTGTGVLARTTVLFNSSGTGTAAGQSGAGTKITFSTVPQVAIVAIKEDLLSIEEANAFTAAQRAQARANIGAPVNDLLNVSFAVSAAAGALTIALKDAAGNDPTAATPVALTFRNPTLATGTQSVLEVTAATSVVVPSTSTCGFASNSAGRLWIIGWNDGGTFRLGVFNASNPTNIFPLVENGIASSLQVVAAGNAAGQHYTAGAAVTNKAFRILGYVDWTSTGMTAGTWTTTNLNSIQTFGPGVRKPGDVVQKFRYSTTTQFSTTSSTFQTSSLTGSPTLTNAANPVEIHATATIDSVTASVYCVVQLHRGATAIGLPSSLATSAAIAAPVALMEFDFPNTLTPTYTGKVKNTDNVSTAFFPLGTNGGGANMIVTEIMG